VKINQSLGVLLHFYLCKLNLSSVMFLDECDKYGDDKISDKSRFDKVK